MLNVGAVFDSLNVRDVSKMRIPVPAIPEQVAIADVLDAVDQKLESNRHMSATTENLLVARFDEWLARIGDGRESTSLARLARFHNGVASQRYPVANGSSLPVLKIAQLHSRSVAAAERCSASVPEHAIVESGALLFSWSGSLEVEIWTGDRAVLNQHIFNVIPEVRTPRWLVFVWLRHHLPFFRRAAADRATTMGHIKRQHLDQAKVVVPSQSEMESLGGLMRPLLHLLVAVGDESRTLLRLRSELLTGLLNGTVVVR